MMLQTAHKKYRNRPTGGYSSVKESRRAAELKLMEKSGAIRNLREQVPFVLIPAQRDENGKLLERACGYVADFVYDEMLTVPAGAPPWPERSDNGAYCRKVVEDCKGMRTSGYVIKRKLMLKIHGVRIRET